MPTKPATFRRKPAVPKSPQPLEIGLYIGERLAEWGYHPTSTEGNLRLRFARPQNLTVGQRCLYYLWHPYNRTPILIEASVSEVISPTEFMYWMGKQEEVTSWPPGSGYA